MKNSSEAALDINAIIAKAAQAAEKTAKLTPVFLKREANAQNKTSFGSLCLDYITGGGIPSGRIVGIAGPEHVGKSLIATDIMREHLEAGGSVAYFDAEGGNDPLFMKNRGIDLDKYRGSRNKAGDLKPGQFDRIHYYQPQTGEEFRYYLQTLLSALPENREPKGIPLLIVLDSVKALIPEAHLDSLDENMMAYHARMYSEMLPVIQGLLTRTGCSLVYTNQLRLKPGVSMGSPEYEPCGESLKFFSAIRLRLSSQKPKIGGDGDHPMISSSFNTMTPKAGGVWEEPHYTWRGDKWEVDGLDRYVHTGVRTVKNKVWNPQKLCFMRINFEKGGATGHGMDLCFDLFTFMLETGFVERDPKEKGYYKLVKPAPHGFDMQALGFPERFAYHDLKQFAEANPGIRNVLRQKLMVSGLIFSQEGIDPNNKGEGE